MSNDLVTFFGGAMVACVIFAGLSARLVSADPHQFDALMGLPPVAVECSGHNASEVKPLAPLVMRQSSSSLNLFDALGAT